MARPACVLMNLPRIRKHSKGWWAAGSSKCVWFFVRWPFCNWPKASRSLASPAWFRWHHRPSGTWHAVLTENSTLASPAHFREKWRLRNPPIPRWSVFGRASEGTIGPVYFGSVRRIGRARLLSVRVSLSTLAGELVLQSPSAILPAYAAPTLRRIPKRSLRCCGSARRIGSFRSAPSLQAASLELAKI